VTHKVYISYSSWDKAVADNVCRELEAAGISCWIAPRDVSPGANSTSVNSAAIAACQIVVLILSSRSDSSRNVIEDIGKAQEESKQIIPMLIEDFQPGPNLSYYLSSLHWLDAFNVPLSDAVYRLSKNISQTLQQYEDVSQAERRSQHTKETISQKDSRISQLGTAGSQHYDVFISYRRATDAQTARLIRSEIQHRGFRVFLDVDDLRPGYFDEALLKRIDEAQNFVLILSSGSLDRCKNSDDWMRREIECAFSKKKRIIPVIMPGFVFPTAEDLPEELKPLLVHHAISYSHEFFAAMMEKIVGYLNST
jgi:hypothetical protein